MSDRGDLTPSSALPLAYFALAHLGLALALVILVLQPGLPGPFFFHPRMVAVVHLVSLAWLSGSILGAFYIVGPLALRLPLPVRWGDWVAFLAFALGAIGMVTHFWIGGYDGMVWAAGLAVAAIARVAVRAWRGLLRAAAPWPIKLHVALAFVNMLAAAILGMVLGIDRSRGFLAVSPLAATYAHAHLAAVGWATMMVVGLGYRLIPMMLPAAMPTGSRLALSAVLIQTGLIVVVVSLMRESAWLPIGGALIAAGLVSFVVQIHRTFRHRMPRPPALPSRDWSTWQARTALLWLLVAVVAGLASSIRGEDEWSLPLAWCYGVAGLVGFLAQIVVGIQGRLVPMYAWYRALAAREGRSPVYSVHQLPSLPFARAIFVCWAVGVPVLAWGLAHQQQPAIALSAATLLVGVAVSAAYLVHMLRKAQRSA